MLLSTFLRVCVCLPHVVRLPVAGGYKMGGKTRVLSPDRSRDSGSQCPRVVWGQAATACPFKHLGDLAEGIAIVT